MSAFDRTAGISLDAELGTENRWPVLTALPVEQVTSLKLYLAAHYRSRRLDFEMNIRRIVKNECEGLSADLLDGVAYHSLCLSIRVTTASFFSR